jgi:hypothetical protein
MNNEIKVNDKVMAGVKELVQNIGNAIVYYEGQVVKINKVNSIVSINNKNHIVNNNNIYNKAEYYNMQKR